MMAGDCDVLYNLDGGRATFVVNLQGEFVSIT